MFRKSKSWAPDLCLPEGNLACINDIEENNFIHSIAKWSSVWLGGFDSGSEGYWEWTDGSQVNFTNWATGRPHPLYTELDCLTIQYDGKWKDVICTRPKYYVCQS